MILGPRVCVGCQLTGDQEPSVILRVDMQWRCNDCHGLASLECARANALPPALPPGVPVVAPEAVQAVTPSPTPANAQETPAASHGVNPKEAFGSAKAGTFAIPRRVYHLLGLAMGEGAGKYGRFNYRVTKVRASTYIDAMDRHVGAWVEGQDTDPDSGLPHLVKAMACLAVLLDASLEGTWFDDRPPGKDSDGKWLEQLHDIQKAMQAKLSTHAAPNVRKP